MKKLLTNVFYLAMLLTTSNAPCWPAKNITSSNLNEYISRSAKGDALASYELSYFFSSEETYDFLNYYFYLRLSAQQGSCDGLREFKKLQKDSNLRAEFKVSVETMNSIPACMPETRD